MADSINEEPICYYSLLGISKTASISEIRRAYHKLAMKWHPDRWTRNPALAAEAKRRFQQIQEAYSVLSNESKRSIYDAGLFDPLEEEDEGFYDFMQEMLAMMESVRPEVEQRGNCLEEELQRMFMEMTSNQTYVYDDDDDDDDDDHDDHDLPVNKRTRVSYNQDVCV